MFDGVHQSDDRQLLRDLVSKSVDAERATENSSPLSCYWLLIEQGARSERCEGAVPATADCWDGHRVEFAVLRLFETVLSRLVELLGAVGLAVLVPLWRVRRDYVAVRLGSAKAGVIRKFEGRRYNIPGKYEVYCKVQYMIVVM